MTQENTAPQTAKIGSINTLRFIAALGVVFYHLTFVFYNGLNGDLKSYIDLPLLRNLSQYGYLGVDLFFIISGFVIALSVDGRNTYGFIKSRIGRLYPVFWVSAIITSLFLLFAGYLIDSQLSPWRFFTNMTMIPTILFGKEYIDLLDGSYWTLAVEMKFYFIIFLFLLFKQIKKIEYYAIPLSTVMLLSSIFLNIKHESDLIWIPNFIAGVLFYKIYKEGLNNWRIFGLLNAFLASLIFATNRISDLSLGYNTIFSATNISLYILAFYIIFLLISLNKFRITNNKYINTLGLLTYPVYLLHQQISKIMFSYAKVNDIPLYVSFPFVVMFIFILAYAVHKLFERRGKIILDKILDKITPPNLKRL